MCEHIAALARLEAAPVYATAGRGALTDPALRAIAGTSRPDTARRI